MDEIEQQESEFGKGLTYCLALFLCHSERNFGHRYGDEKETQCDVETWFYGAADHMHELQIPDALPETLRDRLAALQEQCLIWRLPMDATQTPTAENKKWAIQEAKDLILAIDAHFGVPACKASWD